MSIRLRLIVWQTVLVGVLLTGSAFVVYAVVERHLTSRLDNAIDQRALAASWAVQASLLEDAPTSGTGSVLDLPRTVAEAEGRFLVQLVDPSGHLIGRSENLARPLPMPATTLGPALAGVDSTTTATFAGERLKIYTCPLLIDGTVMGVLQVAAPLQPLEDYLARLRVALAAGGGGATLLAAALGWFIATKAMRPVDRLTQSASAIGRSRDFGQRLPVPRQRDELGRLARTFNTMLGQLGEAFATQRRFLDDASHELRSPLTLIQTSADLALREADADQDARRDSLRTIAREANRMGRLVADLLVFARADAAYSLVRQRCSLDTLFLEVYEQQRMLATDVRLVVDALEQVEVKGDPDRLKQLLLNLVDNAVQYTPVGGAVTLTLVRGQDGAELRVADTGPGISPEHLPRIFDRFYRIDQSASRDRGGSGLGLAICRWVADAHGGRIEVASRLGAGTTFTVFLPAAGCPADRPQLLPSH